MLYSLINDCASSLPAGPGGGAQSMSVGATSGGRRFGPGSRWELAVTPHAEAEVLILNGPDALSHADMTNRQPHYHSFRDALESIAQRMWSAGQCDHRRL